MEKELNKELMLDEAELEIVLDNLVRPSPDNAPTVISSMDIKTSLNPIMTR